MISLVNINGLYIWLVIWNMAGLFSPIVGMMIQSDELIFFRGVGIPPISYVFFFLDNHWDDDGIYPPVISSMAGRKIPEVNFEMG